MHCSLQLCSGRNWTQESPGEKLYEKSYSLIHWSCHHGSMSTYLYRDGVGTYLNCVRIHTAHLSPSCPELSFHRRNVLLKEVLHTFREVEKAFKSVFNTLWHWNARVVCTHNFNMTRAVESLHNFTARSPLSALWMIWRWMSLCN